MWELIKSERGSRYSGGVKVGNKWFHTDLVSKTQHISNKDTARDQLSNGGKMTDALLDPVNGGKINWKTMDGSFVTLTCNLAFDIVKECKRYEIAVFQTAENHRVAMEASKDPSSYDYSTGWPSCYSGKI